jgi:ABC-type Fe3+ transport system substrate-binding protein
MMRLPARCGSPRRHARRGFPPWLRVALRSIALSLVLLATAPAGAQAPLEDRLVLQTSVSKLIVDAAVKAFAEYTRERSSVVVTAVAQYAGSPVSYGRIVEWKGKPEADILWGGESVLYDKLAAQGLLVRHEVAGALAGAIPPTLGAPKPVTLKDPRGYWIGSALDPQGLVYHPRLFRRLGIPEPKSWDDLLDHRLKGNVVQCAPTRSAANHAMYEVILQLKGEEAGWEWLKRLAANTGLFTPRSRDVPAVVAKGEFAAGFAVPSYMAFEETLAGFDIKFIAPRNAFVTTEPVAILAGARHRKAAKAFIEFLLTERGQRVFMEHALLPIVPRYKVEGPPGSLAEKAVAFMGGLRSYFEGDVAHVYDEEVAQRRYQEVNGRYRREIEAVWEDLKRRY